MALKRVNFATAHNASQFTSARWNFQPVPDGFGNAPIQLVEIAPGNPRFAYDPVTGEPQGILIEEQRTNLMLHSNDFTDPTWIKVGADVQITAQPSFTGFWHRLEATAEGVSYTQQPIALTSSNRYVWSVIAKSESSDVIRLLHTGAGVFSESGFVDFNLSQGVVVNAGGGATGYIEDLGSGAYLCVLVTEQTIDNGAPNFRISTTGDIGSSVLIDYSGLEQGTFATSPIITNGTAVTRTADNVVRTLGAEWNPNEGTFVVDFELPQDSNLSNFGAFLVGRDAGSNATNNSISLRSGTATNGRWIVRYGDSAGATVDATPSRRYKAAVKYDQNFAYVSVNGSAVVSAARTTDPSLFTRFTLGHTNTNDYLNGTVSLLKYEPRAVSDTELQELSTL